MPKRRTSSWSSTNRIVSPARARRHPGARPPARPASAPDRSPSVAARREIDPAPLVPVPISLDRRTCPPDCLTKPYTVDRPSPDPLPVVLRREERLEHLAQEVRRDPAARCRSRDISVRARRRRAIDRVASASPRDVRRLDHEAAALAASRRAHSPRRSAARSRAGCRPRTSSHRSGASTTSTAIVSPSVRGDHVRHACDERVRVEQRRRERLAPAEREQPLHELPALRAARCAAVDRRAEHLLARLRRPAGRTAPAGSRGVAISRLPRTTWRRLLKSWAMPPVRLPDGLHLLRLVELTLGLDAAPGLGLQLGGAVAARAARASC